MVGNQTFECEVCGKEFETEKGLKIHKGKKHHEKPLDKGDLRLLRRYLTLETKLEEARQKLEESGLAEMIKKRKEELKEIKEETRELRQKRRELDKKRKELKWKLSEIEKKTKGLKKAREEELDEAEGYLEDVKETATRERYKRWAEECAQI